MRPPIRFGPGIVCPPGYLCIPGMEPIKLPDVEPDVQDVLEIPLELPPTQPMPPMGQPGGYFLPSWPEPESWVQGTYGPPDRRHWSYPVWSDGLLPTDPGYVMYPFPKE